MNNPARRLHAGINRPMVLVLPALTGLLLMLGGCSLNTVMPDGDAVQDASGQAHAGQPTWRYVRFVLNRDDNDEVASFLDLLIADRLIADVLAIHEPGIRLWRFHRRWPRDATGHQFSFIFFASPDVTAQVLEQIERAPLLKRLRADGHLREFRVDEAKAGRGADPAATSDPSWSPVVQQEWPEFLMGASRMWLGLVRKEAAGLDHLDLYPRYTQVEERLDAIWFEEGNHAFFHHLSALFGYKPLRVIRRDVMTF
jgi:hypothetical protein